MTGMHGIGRPAGQVEGRCAGSVVPGTGVVEQIPGSPIGVTIAAAVAPDRRGKSRRFASGRIASRCLSHVPKRRSPRRQAPCWRFMQIFVGRPSVVPCAAGREQKNPIKGLYADTLIVYMGVEAGTPAHRGVPPISPRARGVPIERLRAAQLELGTARTSRRVALKAPLDS